MEINKTSQTILDMIQERVQSSNLTSVGYDFEKEILEIEFNRSGVYQHFDVPVLEYKAFVNAQSHGK